MAAGEITGASPTDLRDLKQEFIGTPTYKAGISFGTAYCLARIGKQPEDYDGPQRYCQNRVKRLSVEEWEERYTDVYNENDTRAYAPCCRFHGGLSHAKGVEKHLDPLANLQHGYYAMEESLLSDLNEAEREAYDEIMERGAAEGITREDDFFSWESLQSLALNIVADRRIRQIINDEGVVKTVNVFQEGALVDQNDEEHHLIKPSQAQRRLIEQLKDNLALTRKHKDEMDAISEGTTVEFLAEGMSESLNPENREFNPDDWEDDSGNAPAE